jgi:hypothetical protein
MVLFTVRSVAEKFLNEDVLGEFHCILLYGTGKAQNVHTYYNVKTLQLNMSVDKHPHLENIDILQVFCSLQCSASI